MRRGSHGTQNNSCPLNKVNTYQYYDLCPRDSERKAHQPLDHLTDSVVVEKYIEPKRNEVRTKTASERGSAIRHAHGRMNAGDFSFATTYSSIIRNGVSMRDETATMRHHSG